MGDAYEAIHEHIFLHTDIQRNLSQPLQPTICPIGFTARSHVHCTLAAASVAFSRGGDKLNDIIVMATSSMTLWHSPSVCLRLAFWLAILWMLVVAGDVAGLAVPAKSDLPEAQSIGSLSLFFQNCL